MTAPKPATIANDLTNRINERTALMTEYISSSDFQFKILERDANKLQEADAPNAFLCKAHLAHMRGDLEEIERFLVAAERINHDPQEIEITRLICYSNLGFATKGLASFRSCVDIKHGNILRSTTNGVASGAFQSIQDLMNQAKAAKLEFSNPAFMAVMESAAHLLKSLDISDEQCALVIDAAGEVLRSRKLFWMDRHPSVFVNEQSKTVAMRFQVAATASQASEMTMETIDKLIERDLDRLPFYVHFLGTEA